MKRALLRVQEQVVQQQLRQLDQQQLTGEWPGLALSPAGPGAKRAWHSSTPNQT